MSYEVLDDGTIVRPEDNSQSVDADGIDMGNNLADTENPDNGVATWEQDEEFWDFVNAYLNYSNQLDDNSGIDLQSINPSNLGYLSTTQLDLFDRILAGKSYRYYIAYRTGSDNYAAVMYACNKISKSGNTITLEKPMQFQLYRSYSGNTYYYYYTHTQLTSDSVTLNSNTLYYTNMTEGYPTLAKIGSSQLEFSKDTILVFGVFLMIIILLFLRRRKNV